MTYQAVVAQEIYALFPIVFVFRSFLRAFQLEVCRARTENASIPKSERPSDWDTFHRFQTAFSFRSVVHLTCAVSRGQFEVFVSSLGHFFVKMDKFEVDACVGANVNKKRAIQWA